MAADVARKTRVGTFGIALCFLAALFFIEAKTTWVSFGGQTSDGISSSKAQAVDFGQTAEVDSKLGNASDRTSSQLHDAVAVNVAFVLILPLLHVHTRLEHRPVLAFDGSSHEQSVRPPPSLKIG